MNKLKEHLISFDSLKSFVPNLYNSSKNTVNKAFFSVAITEADYIMKTDNTEKDLIDLLLSKMEMEVILGLKFILGVMKKYFKIIRTIFNFFS